MATTKKKAAAKKPAAKKTPVKKAEPGAISETTGRPQQAWERGEGFTTAANE